MKNLQITLTEWFLRLSQSVGLLSAVVDRFGFWPKEKSAWGNWDSFLAYTKTLNPYFPETIIPFIGGFATSAEIILSIFLLIPFKTSLFAKLTGFLLLLFGLSMTLNLGIKAPLDYSVFAASAAAFALSLITDLKKRATF